MRDKRGIDTGFEGDAAERGAVVAELGELPTGAVGDRGPGAAVAGATAVWLFSAGPVVFAAGMALAGTPATTAISTSLPPARQGVASAVNDTSRELGGALGIAVLGSLLNDRYIKGVKPLVNSLPTGIAAHAQASISFVQQGASGIGSNSQTIVTGAQKAFLDGFSTATRAAAALLLLSALYVYLRGPKQGQTEAANEHAASTTITHPRLARASEN